MWTLRLSPSCNLRVFLRVTLLKKNESVERIPHSLGTSVTRPLLNLLVYTTLFQNLRAKLRADFLTFWWFLDFDLRANVVWIFDMKKTLIIFVLLLTGRMKQMKLLISSFFDLWLLFVDLFLYTCHIDESGS